jgi:hypothetical protein
MDSDLFHTVSWPFLRVWAPDANGVEQVYQVPLLPLATAIQGSYTQAYADFTLSGTLTAGDFVGLAYLTEHVTYQVGGWEGSAAGVLDQIVLGWSSTATTAQRLTGTNTLRVTLVAQGVAGLGANGNRFAMYSYASSGAGGASTLSWDSPTQTFAHGTSPTEWRVTIPFDSLQGYIDPDYTTLHAIVNPNKIRKLRWTYAADLQTGAYVRSEFQAQISNWSVTGTNRTYSVAGPGSLRFEDESEAMTYNAGGHWSAPHGNYSGGTIHYTQTAGDSVTCAYESPSAHSLYIGLRYTSTGALATITVDGHSAGQVNLAIPGEDVLIRWPVGQYGAGRHTVTVTHAGPANADLYFDFVEAAVPTTSLPSFPNEPRRTLATDWDTEHSLALAPERTAWLMDTLGFNGRANHYAGALWFYELTRPGQVYASATVTFAGGPATNPGAVDYVTVTVAGTVLQKLIHMGDTAATLALAFANELNRGYMSFWGSASGNVLTIYSRAMGADGDNITLSASSSDQATWQATASGAQLAGGSDGVLDPQTMALDGWRTDLTASPRLNRAARDWTTSFFAALNGYGIDATASLSMELQHGDPSVAAGIAQRSPTGDPILLPTPSLQTNFSPTSLAFWQEVYAELAAIQANAGLQPYLQFGEVQWWYFPSNGFRPADPGYMDYHGMGFYDAWSTAQFQGQYGRPMAQITTNTVNPASFPDETAFLATTLGNFTSAIINYVRGAQPQCRFEVLYPTDVNATAFNQAINFPGQAWTPAVLTGLKTECFGFTLGRNLNSAEQTLADSFGFPASRRSHLVGIGDSTTAWPKEVRNAAGRGMDSIVLFALDQYCLIGYAPMTEGLRRSMRMAS